MRKRFIFTFSAIITIITFILSSFLPQMVETAYACYTWSVGQRVGLRGGTEIRTGSGFSYTVHTTLPPDANDWQVDIIDGPRYADGQEWWDISRQNIDGGGTGWVYIAQAGWDLCGTNPGGHIYVASGLELVPDPNHAWPPYEGDKLIGRFTLGNDGGSALHITGYGVRMRRNSTDYWDFLNTNAFDLQPGQTVRFDQNNERPLASGHYRAEITWQVNGGNWEVAGGTEFDVSAPPANVYVASGLELVPDPNHSWPPYEGDKLIGRFTLGNNGGTAVHITGFGVRMRRNSTDYWDFLNTNAFDLQPGQTARFDQNNERPLVSGHYRAEITWQVNGGNWEVSGGTEFDVGARPGGVSAVSSLELIPDPNGGWPPEEGNKLIGRFTLGNDGSSSVRISAHGVRMRRNSSDYWDFLNTNPYDLQPGQTLHFDQNNERPLASGHYRAEITWQENGGAWKTSNPIEFDIQAYQEGVNDGAELVDQSLSPTIPPGYSFQVWFQVRNTGDTIWSGGSGYTIENTNGISLGAASSISLDSTVKPGETYHWLITMAAPYAPGSYTTQWIMTHNGATFGPGLQVGVTVGGQASAAVDLRVVTPLSLPVANLEVDHFTTATFTVKNYGSTTANISGLAAGGRGPGGSYDVQDFPWMDGISIPPGQTYTYQASRSFSSDGRYSFFPVARTWDGQYLTLAGPSGESNTVYLRVSGLPLVFAKSVSVLYQDSANEAIDVITFFPRPQADGSFVTNIRIINKTKLAYALYFHDLGSPTSDPNGEMDVPYVIVPPTSDPDYGGLILHDITFKPDSDLNLVFSAYGTETTIGGDGSILWLYNFFTLFCIYQFGDICPSNTLDASVLLGQKFLDKLGGNLQTLSASYGITEDLLKGDALGLVHDMYEVFKEHPSWLVSLASLAGKKGLDEAAVAKVLGSWQLKFFLAYPRFWEFSRDLGRSKWLGVVEVRLLPTLKPNPYLFQGSGSASSDGFSEQSQPPARSNDAEIQAALEAPVIELNTVRSSSGAFGPGWEYFRLIDGSYDTGWTNGGDLNSNIEWVAFELGNGKPVLLRQVLIHPGPVGGDDPSLALKDFEVDYSYDGEHYTLLFSGSFLASELGSGKVFDVNPVLAHQIRLRALSNQGGTSPAKLSIAEIAVGGDPAGDEDAYEPDDVLKDATLLAAGQSVPHTINHADDWDCHSISMVAGVNYVIQTTDLAAETDTVLSLYGPDGSRIARNDDSGGTKASKIEFTPDTAGLYFSCVYQSDRVSGGPEFTYRMELTYQPSSDWYGAYYNNDHFGGDPTLIRHDPAIDFDWLDGSPDPSLPSDHFSVRWSRVVEFASGLYTFHIGRDDGLRVWVDDQLIYSEWDTDRQFEDVQLVLIRGRHLIRVDAYENGGWAQARFSWDYLPYASIFLPAIAK